MSTHRLPRWLLAPFVALAVLLAATGPAAAQDDGPATADDNEAVAVNTEDGASVFRFAFSIRHVADGVVDQTNTATAQASCTDCRTVAVAFQVILVSGDAEVVQPENVAVAANSECAECFTYASATQLVIDVDGKRLTPEGIRRLVALQRRMREIERNSAEMSDAELFQAVQEAEQELVAIFDEELVPVEEAGGPPGSTADGTTTTTTDGSGTDGGGTTTTTSAGTDPTTTTTGPTTTTAAPTTTAAA